ncbi:hypothetical protein CEXT_521201 [Caerostris extrusa]|uniref:Secreted protein n=1 Tax=Caerostris extrusa TaxID=172846 RepID=A0AAV4W873_CAEEX|nr:hypothetical protein CEXT_521201 [Caerostris extrusa]
MFHLMSVHLSVFYFLFYGSKHIHYTCLFSSTKSQTKLPRPTFHSVAVPGIKRNRFRNKRMDIKSSKTPNRCRQMEMPEQNGRRSLYSKADVLLLLLSIPLARLYRCWRVVV